MESATTNFSIAPHVVWIPDEGEVRLYDAESGQFQTLNSTAAEVWFLLSDGRTFDEVAAEMVRRYAADDPTKRLIVVRDVRTFLDSLLAQGLIA
ncbi:PqqD family protein [Streptomyces sp. NPDC020096]